MITAFCKYYNYCYDCATYLKKVRYALLEPNVSEANTAATICAVIHVAPKKVLYIANFESPCLDGASIVTILKEQLLSELQRVRQRD
jgi:hypothetical protein